MQFCYLNTLSSPANGVAGIFSIYRELNGKPINSIVKALKIRLANAKRDGDDVSNVKPDSNDLANKVFGSLGCEIEVNQPKNEHEIISPKESIKGAESK